MSEAECRGATWRRRRRADNLMRAAVVLAVILAAGVLGGFSGPASLRIGAALADSPRDQHVAAKPTASRAPHVVQRFSAGARADWTAGVLEVRAASAADLRSPSAAVARVGAERRARVRARSGLRKAAGELELASGATVAVAIAADKSASQRLDALLARSRGQVHYSTDGSARVVERIGLEGVRLAVSGISEVPADSTKVAFHSAPTLGPTAVIVDARDVLARPALGLMLSSQGSGVQVSYAGPTVFYQSYSRAIADLRLGPRVVRRKATLSRKRVLVLERLDSADAMAATPATVAALRDAGALVVVVLGVQ